ncbi:AraC family transcriptional regulator [Paenibacillus polygoni]|uniref:AraC family transcriptional regulator n=1 Tax=Paenibacillus polygoni TaxID=3050112 RepID=A0ABY8WZM7_9BACL|nr:AraC family transcriptional regulator [Paenibacillus polygoni]WIV17438.1 AraC family transcriptional regulator [Paenibacillus polygoni]
MSIKVRKAIKAPQEMEKAPDKKGSLHQNGLTVITFCLHTQGKKGAFFLKDHLLLFVKSGIYTVHFNKREYTVRSNEMIFIPKSTLIEYDKSGEFGLDYTLDYMMFFLNEQLLEDFVQFADVKLISPVDDYTPVSIMPVNELTQSYFASLQPYLKKPENVSDGLVKVKMMELLFHLADSNERFLNQLLQSNHHKNDNIGRMMEENFKNPVSLHDLAYMSGRSLSTFKREFQATFHTSPLKWIRNRRLDEAKKMLLVTTLSVTDICYTIGFENIAHFSKVFKLRFGLSPSEYRKQFTQDELNGQA